MASYLGNSPETTLKVRATSYRYVATSSQTVFSGTDSNGLSMIINLGDVEVFLNGVMLDQTDYTYTNTAVTLGAGATVNDIVEIITHVEYATANIYSKEEVDVKVSSAISDLVGTAGSALNTLGELSDALGDDANYAATITAALGTKANTSSLGTLATVSPTGTANSSTFLRGDNSWASIASSQWTTNGSNIHYSSGNVGIGISSPGTDLQINDTTTMGSGSSTADILTVTNNNAVVSGIANDKLGIVISAMSDLSDRRVGIYNRAGNVNFNNPDLSIWQTGQGIAYRETLRIRADSATLQFNSGFGSVATAYGVRAWVNFSAESGSPSIQSSGNISSIGDRGAGQFTINFSNAFPDANYALSGSVESQTGWQGVTQFTDAGGGSPATTANKGTSQCMIVTSSGSPSDFAEVSVIFVR